MRRFLRVFSLFSCLAALCAAGLLLPALLGPGGPPVPATAESAALPSPPPSVSPSQSVSSPESAETAGYRAVWISYLEWQHTDFSGSEQFTADIAAMLDNCAGIGANVVIAHVRPFGDALYFSELFPFSHLCTGTQGQDPGFDPLAILLEQAHARGLEVEAWINPYRLQAGGTSAALADTGLAALHPGWVREAAGGLWLDPALPEVQDHIAAGVEELCRRYEIDGIHFDDYFYPTTDPAFDGDAYAAYRSGGGTLTQADWRRENVSALVAKCYAAAHGAGVRFGIAPQGSLENNYNGQYSDVARWLAEPGYADYLMPQLYWGLEYETGGSTALALDRMLARWQALPRCGEVQLYVGLGAYRIGEGDGSDSGSEWQSGGALANQARWLAEQGVAGTALYRYDSLFENTAWPELAAQECAALRAASGA